MESSDKAAAIADRARLQKEARSRAGFPLASCREGIFDEVIFMRFPPAPQLAEMKQKYESLRTDSSFKPASAQATRSAVAFTLLHLLLTAFIAFALGRYT